MAACGERTVGQAFHAFAGGPRMDGRAFVKCLREAGLLDSSKVRAAEADLIFTKCRPKGERKIDLMLFRQALSMVAAKLDVEDTEVFASVRSAGGTAAGRRPASPEPKAKNEPKATNAAGTNRSKQLFYDRSSYTGTHKNGGPTLLGSGMYEHDVISDQELVNRSLVARHKSALGQYGLQGLHSDEEPPSLPQSPLQRERAVSKEVPSERSASKEVVRGRGPERFFYDRSTYTGTHRHGGPEVLGNGMPKKGYSDLSEVVDRDTVLDDALHRRQRSKSHSRDSTPDGRRLPTLLGQQRIGMEARGSRRPAEAQQAQEQARRKEVERGIIAEMAVLSRPTAPAQMSSDLGGKGEVIVDGSPRDLSRSNSVQIEFKVEVPVLQQATVPRRRDEASTPATPHAGVTASMPSSGRISTPLHFQASLAQTSPTPPVSGMGSAGARAAMLQAQSAWEMVGGYPVTMSAAGYPATPSRPSAQQGLVGSSPAQPGVVRFPSSGGAPAFARSPTPMTVPSRTPTPMLVPSKTVAAPGNPYYMTPWTCVAR